MFRHPANHRIIDVRAIKGLPHVGRCKGCRRGAAAVVTHRVFTNGKEYAATHAAAYLVESGKIVLDCACGKRVSLQPVRGVYSAKHECNARCLASTGPSCECTCGGRNHG